MEVRAPPGQVSSFRVYFPRASVETARPTRPGARGERPRGNETILLVEDESAVRRPLARLLSGQGYDVIEAENGRQALELE